MDLHVRAGDYFGFYWKKYGVVSYDNITSQSYCGKNIKPIAGKSVALSTNDAFSGREYAISYKFCELSKFIVIVATTYVNG